jgi:hypothetical protein
MAIAFRSAGTRMKADVSSTGGSQSIALPAGHTAGDLLLGFLMWDDNTGPFVPGPWKVLFVLSVGPSSSVPFAPYPKIAVIYQIDSGSLGSTNAVTFSTAAWPSGSPYALGTILAYSGCDPANPIGEFAWGTTAANSVAEAHPQLTLSAVNDWLVTARAVSSDPPAASFTNSVGTDAERVDDNTGFVNFNQLSFGIYDSNAALSTGLPTQRTTTASRIVAYGSIEMSIALRPVPAGGVTVANAGTASGTGQALGATAVTVNKPWDLCGVSFPVYDWAIDWDGDGTFTGTGENATGDILDGGVQIDYGRDQARQLAQAKIGSASFSVNNTARKYSPDWLGSVLNGNLDPAKQMRGRATFNGVVYPLTFARIDDYVLHADQNDRSVDFTFLDGMDLLNGANLSTPVLGTQRTGALVNYILDQIGWTAGRDIDPGATIVPYWWVEGATALSAVQDLVKSEGPPAIAYVGPDGTFVFRDRHHRVLRQQSINSQATFTASEIDCAVPVAAGLHFTAPFTYDHGGKNIVNSVTFPVDERAVTPGLAAVYTSSDTIALGIGESRVVTVSGSDPFINAVTPVLGTDFTTTGVGTVQVQLSRTSGAAVNITFLAIGGSVVISGLQLRAQAIPVVRTTLVSQQDTASITNHGQQAYGDTAPWADKADAYAVAEMILLHYAERRPNVSLRIVAQDPQHYTNILARQISDRIHITNGETGTDADFFIETVSHHIDRMNQSGQPPVHAVTLGCEMDISQDPANPFRFDVRGSGFDQGVFDPISSDSPDTVFIFDDIDSGVFDFGQFGT